jgi:hypothetical protein
MKEKNERKIARHLVAEEAPPRRKSKGARDSDLWTDSLIH